MRICTSRSPYLPRARHGHVFLVGRVAIPGWGVYTPSKNFLPVASKKKEGPRFLVEKTAIPASRFWPEVWRSLRRGCTSLIPPRPPLPHAHLCPTPTFAPRPPLHYVLLVLQLSRRLQLRSVEYNRHVPLLSIGFRIALLQRCRRVPGERADASLHAIGV
jgi:hypothetical protein